VEGSIAACSIRGIEARCAIAALSEASRTVSVEASIASSSRAAKTVSAKAVSVKTASIEYTGMKSARVEPAAMKTAKAPTAEPAAVKSAESAKASTERISLYGRHAKDHGDAESNKSFHVGSPLLLFFLWQTVQHHLAQVRQCRVANLALHRPPAKDVVLFGNADEEVLG